MEWTQKDAEYLRNFRGYIDYDGIKIKEQVKKSLLHNKYIVHVLHNKDLEDADAEPEDYFGVNIRPYYIIPDIQSHATNFICYSVGFRDMPQWDKSKKYLQLTFVVLCMSKDIIDRETSLPRHDLLAALLQDQFNYTNIFGNKIKLVSDVESVVDNNYLARTLLFESFTDANLVKSTMFPKTPRFANKDVITLGKAT